MSKITPSNGGNNKGGSLSLDKANGKLFGVCSGLANWSGVDALWWRLGFVGTTLMGFGLPVLI